MTVTRKMCSALLAAGLAVGSLGAESSRADLTQVNIYNNTTYIQNAPAAPTTPLGYFFNIGGKTDNAGDFDSASATYPGPGSPQALSFNGNSFTSGSGFVSTLADEQAAFPFGTYTITASNSVTLASHTGVIQYTADHFASDIPALTPATFSGLQGLNPSGPLTVSFNAFTPDAASTAAFTFFTISNAATNAVVFTDGFLSPSTTSLLLPANTLLPNTTYNFELDFSDRVDGVDSTNSVLTEQGSDVRTDGSFTTGGVPEPATAGLLAAGLACVMLRRRGNAHI